MGRNRVVIPGSVRKPISDGDWVEIKNTLNTGDTRRLEACGLKPPMMVGDRIISPIDWGLYELERVLVYLTAWSLCGPDGEVLPLTLESVKALYPDSFNEVNKVILEHKMEQDKAKNPSKGTENPAPEQSLTLSSETSASETT